VDFNAGAGSEKLLKFKKWFWSILEKMPMAQRQDLVSFGYDGNLNWKIVELLKQHDHFFFADVFLDIQSLSASQ
jgi:hypothetical protein